MADALPDIVDVGSMVDVVPGDMCELERGVDPKDRDEAIRSAARGWMPPVVEVAA